MTKAVQTLKALFPARSVPKGSALVLERSKSGQLRILADDEVLGSMQHEWMSRELFAAYFADDNVISAKVSQGEMWLMVAEGECGGGAGGGGSGVICTAMVAPHAIGRVHVTANIALPMGQVDRDLNVIDCMG